FARLWRGRGVVGTAAEPISGEDEGGGYPPPGCALSSPLLLGCFSKRRRSIASLILCVLVTGGGCAFSTLAPLPIPAHSNQAWLRAFRKASRQVRRSQHRLRQAPSA